MFLLVSRNNEVRAFDGSKEGKADAEDARDCSEGSRLFEVSGTEIAPAVVERPETPLEKAKRENAALMARLEALEKAAAAPKA